MGTSLGIRRRLRAVFGSDRRVRAGSPGGGSWDSVVDVIYQAALDRTPDAVGRATYGAALADGTLAPLQVLANVRNSAEGRQVRNHDIVNQLLPMLYEALLQRSPTAAEHGHWHDRVRTGALPIDILREVVGSSDLRRFQLNGLIGRYGMQALFLAEYRRRVTLDE